MDLVRSIKKRYNKWFKRKKTWVYSYFLQLTRPEALLQIQQFEVQPLISVISEVRNNDVKRLMQMVASLKLQYYNKWELCITNRNSSDPAILNFLETLEKEPNVRVIFLKNDISPAEALNESLANVSGEYVAFINACDEITPDAFYEAAYAINISKAEFIYSDEDKLGGNGQYLMPDFKPDFSLDLLLSKNYIGKLAFIHTSLIKRLNGFDTSLEDAFEYDMYLKCSEVANKVYHISKVLYHQWIQSPVLEKTTSEGKRKALQNFVRRNGIYGEVADGLLPNTYRVKRAIIGQPLISIIIPFKDKPELLRTCIDSILAKSSYDNYEIIGISNNSSAAETFDLMRFYEEKSDKIKFYEYNIPFNYSAINNYAAKIAKGSHLLLLNNDIEIISEDWLEALLEQSQRPEVGAVGARLLYPDGTIQHAGVGIGIGGLADHLHKFFPGDSPGYAERILVIQNFSAVTGACLMLKKSIFEQVGGLEEQLEVAFNDVDLCLRLREYNYLNVYTPFCLAFHHESISRGVDDTPEKQERADKEIYFTQQRHEKILKAGDPYYNINFSLYHLDYSLDPKHLKAVKDPFFKKRKAVNKS